MPYIKPSRRKSLDPVIDELIDQLRYLDANEGDLNYTITRILVVSSFKETPRYATLNSLVGVLECVKMEFYRIFAAPYEDEKSKENGPV